jgi:hypothetical protein
MTKTLDGKRAGLQRASALRDEMIDHRRREIQVFESVSIILNAESDIPT